MTSTFTPPCPPTPSGLQKITTPRVLMARFGDGYSQRARDGINNIARSEVLKWDALTPSEADTIESFLNARGGSEAFYYTLPGDTVQYKWTAGPVTRTENGSISKIRWSGISVTLTQEFDL